MEFRIIFLFAVFYLLEFISDTSAKVYLDKLSTTYIPYRYDGRYKQYEFGQGAAKQMAYDSETKMVYVVGAAKIQVVDISRVRRPRIVYHLNFRHFNPTDVEVCGDFVYITLDNEVRKEKGRLNIYRKYTRQYGGLGLAATLIIGASPDMISTSEDCNKILVALEGKAYTLNNATIIDPEAGVFVLSTYKADLTRRASYRTVDFRKFNIGWEKLVAAGVRFVYRDDNNSFSRDLEPEYIAISKDGKKAYVSLQENNAIAEMNLTNDQIIKIHPLGYKNWTNSRFDASDKDSGINLRPWPVYGMYQPDAIKLMYIDGEEYLVTANEGSSKDYSKLVPGGFAEEIKVKNVRLSDESEVFKWAAANNIKDITSESHLGRLSVTKMDGKSPGSNTYDALYAFGGRSFSIWKTKGMQLVYDSGDEIEQTHRSFKGEVFNSYVKMHKHVFDTKDKRSDNKGPECESIEIAKISENKTLIIIGNERPGSISVYSVTNLVQEPPKFESIFFGFTSTTGTWGEQFKKKKLSEINPEDIKYLPPKISPNQQHMLLVAGSSSGTLSLFNIVDDSNAATPPGTRKHTPLMGSPSFGFLKGNI